MTVPLTPSPASPPGARSTPLSGAVAPMLCAAALLAAVAVLHVRDPHRSGSYGFCPWLLVTGTYCLGCGGLRAVHDLSHADLAGALSSNLLVVAAAPVALLLWAAWLRARLRGPGPVHSRTLPLAVRPWLWSLPVVLGAFGVLRNLDFAAWLAP